MYKKLKVNKYFKPCKVDAEDEIYANGIFKFNITKMLDYIQANPDKFHIEKIDIDSIFCGFSKINESHVDYVDISKPLILAEIAPGQYNLIDGNHRLEKANRTGAKKMSMYRIKVDTLIKFIIDKDAYLTYVEYWNSKIKNLSKYGMK